MEFRVVTRFSFACAISCSVSVDNPCIDARPSGEEATIWGGGKLRWVPLRHIAITTRLPDNTWFHAEEVFDDRWCGKLARHPLVLSLHVRFKQGYVDILVIWWKNVAINLIEACQDKLAIPRWYLWKLGAGMHVKLSSALTLMTSQACHWHSNKVKRVISIIHTST
jgi:hypothetical protein